MIRINLAHSLAAATGDAGVEALESADTSIKDLQRQGGVKMLILLLGPLALYAYEFQNIPDMKAKLQSKTALLDTLTRKNESAKSAVEEIKKFKEDKDRLQKQIDTLDGLQKERLREVKILDNLQKDIPEKAWLSRMDFKEGRLTLSGLATSDLELTVFMENLSKSVFLKDVNLVKSTEQMTDKGLIKAFEIICTIDRPVLPQTGVPR